MYDPGKLVHDFEHHNVALEAHWNDAYGTIKPYKDEFLRTLINTGEEILNHPAQIDHMRRKLRNQMTEVFTNQKAAGEATKTLFNNMNKDLAKGQRSLMRAELAYAQETLLQAAKNVPNASKLSHLDIKRKIAAEEAAELAEKVAKRQARLTAIEEATEKTMKALKEFNAKEFFKNPGRFLNKQALASGGKGVIKGAMWDGLRAGFHTLGDKVAESYWTTFLEKNVQVNGVIRILKNYNKIWLSMRSDHSKNEKMHASYKMLYEESKMIQQRYQSKMSGDTGLHVLVNKSIEGEGAKAKVIIKTRGMLYGVKGELKGDAGSADLEPDKKLPYYNTFSDAIVQEQIDDIDKVNTWNLDLPAGKSISKLTKSSGNLKLTIEVQ
jgi:hypothetical protein